MVQPHSVNIQGHEEHLYYTAIDFHLFFPFIRVFCFVLVRHTHIHVYHMAGEHFLHALHNTPRTRSLHQIMFRRLLPCFYLLHVR
jgi:hypothetical protein